MGGERAWTGFFSVVEVLPRPALITGHGLTQYACVLSTQGKQTRNL